MQPFISKHVVPAVVLLLSGVRFATLTAADESPRDASIESLAQLARQSVVRITQFGRDGKENGVGSGFVVAKDGLVATCLHVIGEGRTLAVFLSDGRRCEVTAIHAWDRKLDLALIRLDTTNLPALRLGDSDQLEQGASIVAMGHPLGLEHTFVRGVVSARREVDGVEMIQTALPIEPGNSGGPLLDLKGRVHGLVTLKSTLSPNVGFATPVNVLKRLLDKPNPVPVSRWLTLGALPARDWTPLFGARWSRKGGGIHVEGLGQGFGGRSLCLSTVSPPSVPYELAVTVRLDDEAGAAGLVFASDGTHRHYGFYPTAGQLRLTRFDGPDVFSWTILRTVPSEYYRRGDWNTLRVRVEADRLRCFVNERLVIESDDDEVRGGRVGLAKFRDTKAAFKQFQVGTNLARSEKAVASVELASALDDTADGSTQEPDERLLSEWQRDPAGARAHWLERARQWEQRASRLRERVSLFHRRSVERELVRRLDASETEMDLFGAALCVANLDNPDLDPAPYERQVEDMARELRDRLGPSSESEAKLSALTQYLFAENGFHGARTDYYHRANSYLNDVLDDREGLPITLSVLFLELARRIGLDTVVGVPLPGHFMVKYTAANGDERLIDVFDGGRVTSRSEAQERVIAATGEGFRETHLQPARKREIIVRMLRNLLNVAERSGTASDQLRYLDVIVALAPESLPDRLARVRLRAQTGDRAGAKAELKRLLDSPPEGLDVERVRELYEAL